MEPYICDGPSCSAEFEVVNLRQADTPQFAMTWYDAGARVYPPEAMNPATGVYKTAHFCSKACLDEYVEREA